MEDEGLRAAFIRRLTVDSKNSDRRRKGYNQAIFMPWEEGGGAVFTDTDLDMVLAAFDRAVRDVSRTEWNTWTRI